jgi:osmotically-inducible protein OsmY
MLVARGAVAAAAELRASVAGSLFECGRPALRVVRCDVSGDRVILSGAVPSYHLKQLAQAVAVRVAGVGRVENRIAVDDPGNAHDGDGRAVGAAPP